MAPIVVLRPLWIVIPETVVSWSELKVVEASAAGIAINPRT